MLGMFYAIFILVYLNFVGDESEYNPVMMYYLGLMIGRFVYFDASFSDFIDAVKSMIQHIPLLFLGLALTGLLSYYGFSAGYLLERNYFIVGVFYTQLFMLASVFILHHSHLINLLLRDSKGSNKTTAAEDEQYDIPDKQGEYDQSSGYTTEDELEDYEEYDDYEDYDDGFDDYE